MTNLSNEKTNPKKNSQISNCATNHKNKEQQALALFKKGNSKKAEEIYRNLILICTKNYIIYNNFAVICGSKGRWLESIELLYKALRLSPNDPDIYKNLGVACWEFGDLNGASTFHKTSIKLRPDNPGPYNNLGLNLQASGNLKAAIVAFNTSLKLNPNNSKTQTNLAIALLTVGDYKKGWEKYEWRHTKNKEQSTFHAQPNCPKWDGLTLNSQTPLLLVSEQGLGDTMQFMRYALHLRNQGIAVSICAQPSLHRLIQLSGIDLNPLSPQEANAINKGIWMPLLSLPNYLEVSHNNPIITKPYIKTSDELIAKWKYLLSVEQTPIIGINWQGNPEQEKNLSQGRSLPLETFAPITAQASIKLASLQKGIGSEQLENCSFRDRFVSCQAQINSSWDFIETAAIIDNCDLIITSDTSIAHLAAAMGKPTWTLLSRTPDWRWGLAGDTTFWYPSMRLFRQKNQGNWEEVMKRVVKKLQDTFKNGKQT